MKFEEINLASTPLNRGQDWSSLRMAGAFERGLVSVIVPTYNRAMFLIEAIDSVWGQTYRPIELLVVDDGSTDNTADIVRQKAVDLPYEGGFIIRYLRQPNRGASAARNQGLLYSRGEFIQYLDSDDVLVSHKLARHVAALADEDLDLVWSKWLVLPSGQIKERLASENKTATDAAWKLTDELIPWEPWPTLTRRRFIAAHPLWNELVSRWDDWEYALRLLAVNPKRALVSGLGCIQREHDQGRRYDYDFNPAGVDVGLTACRQAKIAWRANSHANAWLDQLVADRFWDIGLEALMRGTHDQVTEAFGAAVGMATRVPFRVKAALAWLVMKLIGVRATRLLLSNYLVSKPTVSNLFI